MVIPTPSSLALALGGVLALASAATIPNGTVYLDALRPPKERADDLLQLMTWEEKNVNGELSFNETNFEEIRKTQNGQIGFGAPTNYAQDLLPIANKVRDEQINNARLGIPYITIANSVSGLMISGGTLFPGAIAMSSTWNIPLYEQAVAAIRDENMAMGTHWVLSPEVDLAKDPRNGRNGEMFGEDPYLVGEFASHYINTMQQKDDNGFVKIAKSIKHWVYGSSSGGVNMASMQGGLNHILNDIGAPYVKAIKESSPLSLMVSYASVDRIPMSRNRYLNKGVLRDLLGFKSLIMSDAGSIRNMYTQPKVAKSFADAGLKALRGGLEHELAPRTPSVFPTLIDAANDTEIAGLVDEAVHAILEIKFATGTFDLALPTAENLNATLRSEEHLDINRNISRDAIMLLQNDGTLPLQRSKTPRIALLGPYADILNTGQYAANNASDPSYGDTFRRSLERELGVENVKFVAGVDVLGTNECIPDAPPVFAAVGAGQDNLLITGFFGVFKVVSCLFYLLFLVERIGRRGSLLAGAFLMGTYMLIVAVLTATNLPKSVDQGLTSTAIASMTIIYLEAMSYNISWGPAPWARTLSNVHYMDDWNVMLMFARSTWEKSSHPASERPASPSARRRSGSLTLSSPRSPRMLSRTSGGGRSSCFASSTGRSSYLCGLHQGDEGQAARGDGGAFLEKDISKRFGDCSSEAGRGDDVGVSQRVDEKD